MKLTKAIEIANLEGHTTDSLHSPDFSDAIKLLIEAGKAIITQRKGGHGPDCHLLPGETTGDHQDTEFRHSTADHRIPKAEL